MKIVFIQKRKIFLFTNPITDKENTLDELPIYIKQYRFLQNLKTGIIKQTDDLLRNNIIEPSNQSLNCPLWLVPMNEKDGVK